MLKAKNPITFWFCIPEPFKHKQNVCSTSKIQLL